MNTFTLQLDLFLDKLLHIQGPTGGPMQMLTADDSTGVDPHMQTSTHIHILYHWHYNAN